MTIDDLLERGKRAYEQYLKMTYLPTTMPLGVSGLNIVTRADFCLHPDMCFDFVGPGRSLHVLDHSGDPRVLLVPHHVGASVRP